MGGGRDKRKKLQERNDGPRPAKGAAKTEKHTNKNQEKQARRATKKLQGDEDDIDAILASLQLEEKAKTTTTVTDECPPPSARVNASFTPYVNQKSKEIWLFGGECADLHADKVHVYGDLYKYTPDKRRWSRYACPSSPPPRSAHQACIVKGSLYVFGGEFTSPNQLRFHHYKDLWRLHLATLQWDSLPSKAGPSARSGHRMVPHKNKLLLFGGFYDTGSEVRYYNDLWEFDVDDLRWSSVGDPTAQRPAPRSGCQLVVHGDTLYLYGGYSKRPDEADPDIERGRAFDDMWALDLATYTWTKVKKVGMAPTPRASFAMVAHKNRALLFGGVADNEAKGGEDLSSEFFNDLYQFNLASHRWFPAEIRPPKQKAGGSSEATAGSGVEQDATAGEPSTSGAEQEAAALRHAGAGTASTSSRAGNGSNGGLGGSSSSSSTDAREAALHRAAVRIQAHFRGYVVRKAYKVYRLGGAISEILYSPAAFGLDMSVRNMPKPRPRINAQMCVVGNTLWLLGGIVELGEKEVTLDDLWCLDLAKMDGWTLVQGNTAGEELFTAGGSSSSSEEDSDDNDD